MKVLDEFQNIVDTIENTMQIKLKDEDFVIGQEQMFHIFLHETSHAVITNQARWVHDLEEEKEIAVDEILARLLDDELSQIIGLHHHSITEHVDELSKYPVQITIEEFARLKEKWQRFYFPNKNVEGMANELLSFFNKL
jgi:hypothetical protein